LYVNFFCTFPCQTCDPVDKNICNSCYGGDTNQNWYDFQCLTNCPDGFTSNNRFNCTACEEPCATCSETTSTCESCISGYRLDGGKKRCVELVFWPFPWVLFAAICFCITAVSECRTKGVSKFKETMIAMLGLAEVGSWLTFLIFSAHRQGFRYPAIGCVIAIIFYGILNTVHAFIHTRKMIPETPKSYKQIMTNFKTTSLIIRLISYTVSFKFSMILISYFLLRPRLKGDYDGKQDLQFNIFILVFLLTAFPMIISACLSYLLIDVFWSYGGFAAVEVLIVTLFLASITLTDAISVL